MSTKSEPRSIKKSPGQRIRHLQLGADNEYLVVFDWDNGCYEYQKTDWCCSDIGVLKQVKNCEKKSRDNKVIGWCAPSSFDAAEESETSYEDYFNDEDYSNDEDEGNDEYKKGGYHHWYIYGVKRNGTGGHSWWSGGNPFKDDFAGKAPEITIAAFGKNNAVAIHGRNGYSVHGDVDDCLYKRMKRINAKKRAFHNICLSQYRTGGYWIKDDEGTEWRGLGTDLSNDLKRGKAALHVCEGPDGEWVVLRDHTFSCSQGISDRLQKSLTEFYRTQRNYQANRSREIKTFRDAQAAALRQKCEEEKREEEKKRKRELEKTEACKKKQKLADRSEEYLNEAIRRAGLHGYNQVSHNETSRVVGFRKGDVRINIYYSTGTVGTCLKHPHHASGTQLFRRDVTFIELDAIFEDPRVHTGKGYFRCITAQSSSAPSKFSSHTVADTAERDALQMHYNFSKDFARTSTEIERMELILQMEASSESRSMFYDDIRVHDKEVFQRTLIVRQRRKIGVVLKEDVQGAIIATLYKDSGPSAAEDAGLKPGDHLHLVTVPLCGWKHLQAMIRESGRTEMTVGIQCSRAGEIHHFAVITNSDALLGINVKEELSGPVRVECNDTASPSYVAGIRTGDILTHFTVPIGRKTLSCAISPLVPGTSIRVLVSRPRKYVEW